MIFIKAKIKTKEIPINMCVVFLIKKHSRQKKMSSRFKKENIDILFFIFIFSFYIIYLIVYHKMEVEQSNLNNISSDYSGLWTGSVILNANHEVLDISNISMLMLFESLESSYQSFSVKAISILDSKRTIWNENNNVMVLNGIYNPYGEFRLTSQLGGIINDYTGYMEQDTRMILTSNDKELCLRKNGSVKKGIGLLLSGSWNASSININNKIECWPKLNLEFSDCHETHLFKLTGIPLNNDENASNYFTITGEFDIKENKLKLCKKHFSRGNSSHEFNPTVFNDNLSISNFTISYNAFFHPLKLEFEGRGVNSLFLRNEVIIKNPYISKIMSIFDTVIEIISSQHVPSQDMSIQQSLSIGPPTEVNQHCYPLTTSLAHSSSSNGFSIVNTKLSNEQTESLTIESASSSSSHQSPSMPFNKTSHNRSFLDELASLLSGNWEGISKNQKGEVTLWKEVILSRYDKAYNNAQNSDLVYGSGLSIWREKEIPFDIKIIINSSNQIVIIKRHTAIFSNELIYSCDLFEIDKSEIITFISSSLDFKSEGFSGDKVPSLVGSAARGSSSLRLVKSNIDFDLLITISPILADCTNKSSLINSEEVSSKDNDNMADDQTLSHESYNKRKSLVSKDQDVCRICYSATIDCVLVPCGHLCMCMVCARKLEYCPYDRKLIHHIQPIYRV